MIIEKSQDGFRVQVPCKVNLFLEVLGKRDDGYHSLDTVMMAVSLVDELEITRRNDDRIELSIEFPEGFGNPIDGEDLAWHIPADQNNLIVRALDQLRTTLGKKRLGGKRSVDQTYSCDGRLGWWQCGRRGCPSPRPPFVGDG